jgi:hypothetical protein
MRGVIPPIAHFPSEAAVTSAVPKYVPLDVGHSVSEPTAVHNKEAVNFVML